MKNIFEKIIGFGLAIMMLSICKMCTGSYLRGADNKAISNYQKMLFDNSYTIAEYYPEYKMTTVKIMKLPVKMYDFRYFFKVNDVKFEGERTLYSLPKSSTFRIFYLKDDPNFNSANPKEDLEAEKKKNSSKEDLYWGIGWGIFGFLFLMGSIIQVIEDRKKRKEQNAL